MNRIMHKRNAIHADCDHRPPKKTKGTALYSLQPTSVVMIIGDYTGSTLSVRLLRILLRVSLPTVDDLVRWRTVLGPILGADWAHEALAIWRHEPAPSLWNVSYDVRKAFAQIAVSAGDPVAIRDAVGHMDVKDVWYLALASHSTAALDIVMKLPRSVVGQTLLKINKNMLDRCSVVTAPSLLATADANLVKSWLSLSPQRGGLHWATIDNDHVSLILEWANTQVHPFGILYDNITVMRSTMMRLVGTTQSYKHKHFVDTYRDEMENQLADQQLDLGHTQLGFIAIMKSEWTHQCMISECTRAVWYFIVAWQRVHRKEYTRLQCNIRQSPCRITVVWRGTDGVDPKAGIVACLNNRVPDDIFRYVALEFINI